MEDFIGIIVWLAIAIIASVFSSKKKDKKKKELAKAMPSMPSQPQQPYDPFTILDALKQNAASGKKKKNKPQQPGLNSLPEEGTRVTRTKPATPVVNAPKQSPIAADLSDREKLRRAIILSEVLSPKF